MKPARGKQFSFQMDLVVEHVVGPVVEPRGTVRFCRTPRGRIRKDANILVAIDMWSKLPMAKVVSNTTADVALKFIQRYISNNGVPRKLRCEHGQTFRAKKFHFFLQIKTHKTTICTNTRPQIDRDS